ncbi:JmjC domain-containing histone demethylation protein 1 [Coemansia spiralis]|uniref:JmjC domain-containing histone demethylation protein 1 n=2 Tax=Coemansia TaxID=4863 RepID=A0A9W8G3G0_9FUNG|nr:JmjC domain-containing histone demethylation protein 1 [Coemansia umbellata]KAJ2620259.1 JmjC domain-containing histone demethylation protein 1 [Coemansia sp. RSA 1358]KAJ2673211.1 JmjC domain-containing histone demethylation protein 1 [Coemansia spiralis]
MSSPDASDSEEPQECPLCREDAPIDIPAYETWLQCDVCEEWYHGVCVGISASECERIDKYHCKKCVEKHGPSSYKGPTLRRSGRSHQSVDYTRLNEGQPATFNQYLLRLDAHEFDEDDFEHLDNGHTVTADWIRHRDTNDPFIVETPAGLDMEMPDSKTTVGDIAKVIGEDVPVSVMDVLTQEELGDWTLGDWARYYSSCDRQRVLNVISLEVSDTELGAQIQRPRVVDELDLVEKFWPESKRKPNRYPLVKTYCLMGVANAYTDFHIDFSATWVYYHVLSGEKVFYLVPPTPTNMRKFETWSKSPEQAVSLFAENVKQCFEVRVKPGNTLFIPAGWIHAVFTPVDTLVIGGNFLVMQSLNTHIGVYKLEARTRVPVRYRFPFFLKLCRYTAELLSRKWLKMGAHAKARWTVDGLEGAFVLASFLEDRLNSDECDSETAKMLGDRQALGKHVATLIEIVGAELKSRMTPEEWVNREPQLREGCHFRWIRPGVPQHVSLLLAARPRRNRAAGAVESTDKSMTKFRKRMAQRADPARLPRPKLVRGRLSSSTPDTGGEGDGASRYSDGEGMLAVLGTGKVGASTRKGKGSSSRNVGSDSSSDGMTTDSNGGSDVSDSDEGVSGQSNDEDASGLSTDEDSFIVSDSDGNTKKPKRRKDTNVQSISLKRSSGNAKTVSKRPKTAHMHIAERFKIKF